MGGTSIAYHLAQLGWDDVVLLERSQLTSGIHVPFGGSGGAAARLGLPDQDDDVLGRALPAARGGVRVRPGMDRVRQPPARLQRGAHGGAPPPGRLGQDIRPADGAGLGGGGEGEVPADVDRRRPRRRLDSHRRLPRSRPAHQRARRRRPPGRLHGVHQHTGDRDRRDGRAGSDGEHGQGRHRGRGRGDRGRDVRRRARPAGGGADPDHPDVASVPGDAALPRARSGEPPADAARPGPAHLLTERRAVAS